VGYVYYVAYFRSKKESFCDSLQGTISQKMRHFSNQISVLKWFRWQPGPTLLQQQPPGECQWQSIRFVGIHDKGRGNLDKQ
jgi:hypothetical protein